MALTDATQLVEDVILPSIDSEDVLNFEEVNDVVVWVVDAVESREDARILLQHGIVSVITAFGMKFIGLRRDPYEQHRTDSSGVQQTRRNEGTARIRPPVQATA